MGKVGFLVNLAALLVGCLIDSVPKVHLYGEAKKKREASGFLLKVMFEGCLCVSGTFILQISSRNISKLT